MAYQLTYTRTGIEDLRLYAAQHRGRNVVLKAHHYEIDADGTDVDITIEYGYGFFISTSAGSGYAYPLGASEHGLAGIDSDQNGIALVADYQTPVFGCKPGDVITVEAGANNTHFSLYEVS